MAPYRNLKGEPTRGFTDDLSRRAETLSDAAARQSGSLRTTRMTSTVGPSSTFTGPNVVMFLAAVAPGPAPVRASFSTATNRSL